MYFDFGHKFRTDGEFRHRISSLNAEIKKAEEKGDDEGVALRSQDLYMACNCNASLFVPYYFPQAIKGTPMYTMRRPFSTELYTFAIDLVLTIRGSRQISKSTNLVARQFMHADILRNFSSLYIAPHPEHVKTYGTRMKEMWSRYRFYFEDHRFRQNLRLREFPNGSKIELIHILTDSGPGRGKTSDENLYDEYQLFDIDLEPDLLQCQKDSSRQMTVYAGTCTTVDSPLEVRFQQSSQGYWHVRCDAGHWINFGDPKQFIPLIKFDGMWCDKCAAKNRRTRIDVNKGRFVHLYPRLASAMMVGLHIPQLIIPEFVEDANQWSKIYKAFKAPDRPKFLEEICAIPSEAGSREITQQDLINICMDNETVASMLEKARRGYYKVLVSGCDWGGSDDIRVLKIRRSMTYHTIIGIAPDNAIEILYFRPYSGMLYEEIAHDIVRVHKEYNCHYIGTDEGAGQYYNFEINRLIESSRHFVWDYLGPSTDIVSKPSTGVSRFNKYNLNRSESISALFAAIKAGPKKMRCYNWGEAGEHLQQFLNMYRVPAELGTNSGPKRFRYIRAGSKSDDALHAVNFANVLARLVNGEELLVDHGLRRELNMLFNPSAGIHVMGYPVGGGHFSG